MSLQDKVALISGASRGIGAAIATELGRRGAQVVGTATSATGADAITRRFQDQGISGRGLRLDVTDAGSVQEVINTLSEELGSPTILVNNAAVTRDNILMRMKEEEWDQVIATDLSSVYRLSKAVLRGMLKARFGRIVNITSVVGVTGNPGQSNYAAAKAGILGFTKSLAREVGSRGITVNALAPGFIDTDMTKALSEAQRASLIQDIPLNRLGHVQDIANAVAFLVSDEANYITGETLHVNGGMYMN